MTIKRKDLIFLGPEIYLIGATIYYWTLTASTFNPVAIILLLILIYQVIYKTIVTGLIIASLLILLSFYMILALISELSEFTEANEDYKKLLMFGTLFLGFNLIAGAIMLWKYLRVQMLKS
ncbi:MAG: hypothetical protein KDD03_04385 [Gelidibacter sp.]|nr:hypothetical protein [Gelidibacter sp.]